VVLPLGYSFNQDGSILYQALAVTFMAEAYNVTLGWPELLTILITVLIASKGGANIPSGSLVILATVLTAIGLPVEAIALVAGSMPSWIWAAPRSMCSATRSPQSS